MLSKVDIVLPLLAPQQILIGLLEQTRGGNGQVLGALHFLGRRFSYHGVALGIAWPS